MLDEIPIEPGISFFEDEYEDDDGLVKKDKLVALQWQGINCVIDQEGEMSIVKVVGGRPVHSTHTSEYVDMAVIDILSFLQ